MKTFFAVLSLAFSPATGEPGTTPQGSSTLLRPPQVLVVDGVADGPGALQAAIDAARSGDALIVKPRLPFDSTYFPVTIAGKGLFLYGEGAQQFSMNSLTIRDLPAGEEVVIRNAHVRSSFSTNPKVLDNKGTVWFEDCAFVGTVLGDVLEVSRSDSVVLVNCFLGAERPTEFSGPSGSLPKRWAMRAEDSALHAYRCRFLGPDGQSHYGW